MSSLPWRAVVRIWSFHDWEKKKTLSRSLTGPTLQVSDRPLDAPEYLRCAWNFQTPNVEFLSMKIIENKHGCHVSRENPKTPSQIIAGQINKFILFPSSGVYENYRQCLATGVSRAPFFYFLRHNLSLNYSPSTYFTFQTFIILSLPNHLFAIDRHTNLFFSQANSAWDSSFAVKKRRACSRRSQLQLWDNSAILRPKKILHLIAYACNRGETWLCNIRC